MKRTKLEIFVFIIPLTCIFFVFFFLYCRVYQSHGTSMSPTIEDGSKLLVIKNREIHKGDIIVFETEGENAIKRVIAISKDVIVIDEEGHLYINDQLQEEDYIKGITNGEELTYPYTVPEGTYFVLGDNRGDSLDSRFKSIGAIKEDKIVGKVVVSLIPPKIL